MNWNFNSLSFVGCNGYAGLLIATIVALLSRHGLTFATIVALLGRHGLTFATIVALLSRHGLTFATIVALLGRHGLTFATIVAIISLTNPLFATIVAELTPVVPLKPLLTLFCTITLAHAATTSRMKRNLFSNLQFLRFPVICVVPLLARHS